MSGPKAYTLKEMKGIVEHLVEHKAYSEIKGRKMWMDFAKSSSTTRTWQSLKETFIKRILPDIQNPYYHLTRDQVCSFQQRVDVEQKEKNNRLEIRTLSEESINNAENQKDIEQPSTSAGKRNEVEKTSGEEIKSEQIPPRNRSSADTYILEEDSNSRSSRDDPDISKKTTDELLAEFEEPTMKSLKECLAFEYSEPPSVVRDVLNDFETESEDSDMEPQMKIVEIPDTNNTDVNKNATNQEIIVIDDSDTMHNVEYIEDERIIVEGGKEVEIGPVFDHEIITEVTSNNMQGITLNNWLKDSVQDHEMLIENIENVNKSNSAKQNVVVTENGDHEEIEPIVVEDTENHSGNPKNEQQKKSLDTDNNLNSLSTTSDTIIPNNQEVLDAEVIKSQNKPNGTHKSLASSTETVTRKRSISQDKTESKKKKMENGMELKTNGEGVIAITPLSSNNTEVLFEALKNNTTVDNGIRETIQDAQMFDESPENKNPCLKSVSLFDEQFNTTMYTDSEEDIPKNEKKLTVNTVSAMDDKKHEKSVKDVHQGDKKQEKPVNCLPEHDTNQEEPVKHVPQSDKKQEEPVKHLLQGDKKQEEPVKDVPQGDKKQEERIKDVPQSDKEQKEPAIDGPQGDKKQEEPVKDVPQSEKKQAEPVKDVPQGDKKQAEPVKDVPQGDKKQEEPLKDLPQGDERQDKPVKDVPQGDKQQEEPVKDVPQGVKQQDEPVIYVTHGDKKQEEPVKIDPLVGKKQDNTEVVPPAQKYRDIIVLQSNSDSEDAQETPFSGKPKDRSKHLALAFGFVPGTSVTAAHRRRSLRSRNRTKSHRNSCTLNDSSDWEDTCDPEEYVSPPGGRRNRYAKRFRNPKSYQIRSLDEEGCLFVVHGKKIYPLVKNGKNPTYMTMDTLGSSEEEELIWRQKYVEEKKKGAVLQKQLEQANAVCEADPTGPRSPILPATTSRYNPSSSTVQKPTQLDMNKQMNIKQVGDEGKIQITLSKNNEESINLEGHWPQVLPIVQQVMSLFYKSNDTVIENTTANTKPEISPRAQKEDISGLTTPIIDLAARKVADLESEIFKEIEARDKEEKTNEISNVTTRRATRTKKTPSTSTEQSEKPAKRQRKSKPTEQKDNPESKTVNKSKMADSIDTVEKSKMADSTDTVKPMNKRKTKNNTVERLSVESAISVVESIKDTIEPSKKEPAEEKVEPTEEEVEPAIEKDTDNESVKTFTIGPIEPRVTRSRKSVNETNSSTRTVSTRPTSKARNDSNDGEDIRFMLPPGPKTRKSANKNTPNKTRSSENPHEISQDNRSRNSVDSTQGYQDSDFSPAKVNATRKKKLSLTVKKGNRVQRKSFRASLVISPDISQNSSNSSYFVPKKPKSQSTLDSAIYKTESYQILMENRKHSTKKLDVIEETKNEDLRHFNALSKESNDSNIVIEVGSSSNVSLPLSPELSLVENITLSHEIIQNDYQPTINETQAGTSSIGSNISNQYLITDVDISIPLMQQTCELLSTRKDEISSKKLAKKTKPPKSPIKVSELLNKVTAVTSVNNTLSDSLDRKLRDLLLESAQKITAGNKENHMDVDESVVEPKTREKKRCSTPLKKNVTKKTKVVMGPVIDEHMESCSHGGRKSCPPAIDFIQVNENANNSEDVQLKVYKPNPKTRVKKDIIKVKIQRPKNKKRSAEKVTTSVASTNPSVELRCSINETESLSGVLLGTTDSESVELIHNHSETCLQAHECIGDSIEFVESSKSDSIISANSTASLESELVKVMKYVDNLSGEYHRTFVASGAKSSDEFRTPTDTIYNSPVPFNSSLITEDLSDEKPTSPSKWYLFSEDDTNTNIANNRQENMTSNTSVSNYSASLLRLFPIACAVPNLSTVSENSKENEDSRNSLNTDGDTRSNDFRSVL